MHSQDLFKYHFKNYQILYCERFKQTILFKIIVLRMHAVARHSVGCCGAGLYPK